MILYWDTITLTNIYIVTLIGVLQSGALAIVLQMDVSLSMGKSISCLCRIKDIAFTEGKKASTGSFGMSIPLLPIISVSLIAQRMEKKGFPGILI